MKNQNIIFTGLQSWDIPIGSNAKNIARVMSQQNRVLYVNPPQGFRGKGNKAGKAGECYLRKINERLYVLELNFRTLPANSFSWGWMFDVLNRLNNKRVARAILSGAKQLGFENFMHFNDNDIFRGYYLKDFLKPTLSIYYRRDWLQGVDYWRRHGVRLEGSLAGKSDLVLTNSPYLCDTIRQYNPHSYYVGQGVDLSLYAPRKKYPVPEDMQGVSGPIVGYAGAVSSLRLDADLLYGVAREMRDVSFVVVGREDDFFKAHRFHILSNVYFLGEKTPEMLPCYIAHFDVCINPQALNDITRGNYPRKIDEYLALGKPVVATATPTMEIFKPMISLCANESDYVEALRAALDHENDPEKAQENERLRSERIALARSHSWENSVGAIYSVIEQYSSNGLQKSNKNNEKL